MNKKILKRILSLFLVVCLTLGLVWTGNMGEVKATTPDINFDETNIAMSFAVLSDLHLHQSSNAATANVQRQVYRYANTVAALNQLSKNNSGEGIDLLMLAGDYCDIGTEMQATTFAKATQSILAELSSVNNKTTQFIMAYGNHETEAGANTANPHMTYTEWEEVLTDHGLAATAKDAPWGCNHVTVTKGEKTYHFFSLEIYAYATNLILNKALTWLDTELENVTKIDPNAYVYLACHGPAMESGVYGTDAAFDVNASWGTSQSGKTGTTYANDTDYLTQEATSGNLDDVLKKYPQVVHFSGHYHYTNILESTIMQKNYTAVAVSALSDSSPAALWNQGYYDSMELNSMLESYLYNGYSLLVEVDTDGNQRITRVKMGEEFSDNSLYATVTYQSDKTETTDNLNADGTVFEYMDESKYVDSVAFLDALSNADFETLTPWAMNAPESNNTHLLTYSQEARKTTPVFLEGATLDITDVTLRSNKSVSFNVTFDTVGAKQADTNYVIRYELEIYNQDGKVLKTGDKTDNLWFVGNFVSSTKGVVPGSGTSHLDATKLSYNNITLTSAQLSGATGIYAKLYAVDEFGGKSEALTFGSQTDVISVVEPEDSVTEAKMTFVSGNSNNSFYVFTFKPTDESIVLADFTTDVWTDFYLDGKKITSGVVWGKSNYEASGYYQMLIPVGNVEAGKTPDRIGKHLLQFPAGTTVGNIKFANDVYVSINGVGANAKELTPSSLTFSSAGANDNYQWYAINLQPSDGRAITSVGTYSDTIYVDGKEVESGIAGISAESSTYGFLIYYSKIQAKVYTAAEVTPHIITIPKNSYFGDVVLSEDTHIKVHANSIALVEPSYTEVTTNYNRESGARGGNLICIDTSSDPLENGTYAQSSFTEGGISIDGAYLDGVTIQKSYNGCYYIHLDSVASSLKEGSIVTLEGTLTHVITNVTFKKISFIRNADGSFSSYDAEKEAVAADSVDLDEVWVNLDKFGSYDIASVPLVENGKAEYFVNSKTPSSTKLMEVGDYEIIRVLGNAILADTVGKGLGDITYTQTAHLYKTGDANGDGKLSVADIVRQINEEGTTDNLVKGKNDLNYDDEMNDADRLLLVDLMLGNKTAEDIYSADASVVIGAISDTHYMADGSDGQNRINTRKALNYYKSQNAEAIILNGDITDFGEVKAYQKLVEDIMAVYPDEDTRPTFIITGDNHEWYGAWTVDGMVPAEGVTFASLQERFNTELSSIRDGLQDANSYYEVNGYYFIGVSSDGMNGGQCTYDSETIAFVTEKLEAAKNADPNKPIFLAIHQAPPNTVYGSDGLDCFYSAEMDALLKQYPNLVVITSHTHAPLQNEKSISQGNYTTLNTASLYYVGGMSSTENLVTGQLGDIYQFGQGLLIRANGKDVDVERCDFYNDETIKENWTFTAGDNTKYTQGHTS